MSISTITPASPFFESEELLRRLLGLLPWRDVMSFSKVNRFTSNNCRDFVGESVNELLLPFIPEDRLNDFWDVMETAGAALTGELPLALLTRVPGECCPVSSVLEIATVVDETAHLLFLFENLGYIYLDNEADNVEILNSTAFKNNWCLRRNSISNNDEMFPVVVIRECKHASWVFALLHGTDTSNMNAITARSVLAVYPTYTTRKISLPNDLIGDNLAAAKDTAFRLRLTSVNNMPCTQKPCGLDCPITLRVTTDLKYFGQFIYEPMSGPPTPNSFYMWQRGESCQNSNCDNFGLVQTFARSWGVPHDLYLIRDINVRLLAYIDLGKSPTDTIIAGFRAHLNHFLSRLCGIYHLGTAPMLLAAMRRCNALLIDAAALYIFCPTSRVPDTLDFTLAADVGSTNDLTDFLLQNGYCYFIRRGLNDFCEDGEIISKSEIYVHKTSHHRVRLTYTIQSSPLTPVLDSYTTLTMNYISGWNAVCLYPSTTLVKIGIRLHSHSSALNLFQKYARQGFTLRPWGQVAASTMNKIATVTDGQALILPLTLAHSRQEDNLGWVLPGILARSGCILFEKDNGVATITLPGDYVL